MGNRESPTYKYYLPLRRGLLPTSRRVQTELCVDPTLRVGTGHPPRPRLAATPLPEPSRNGIPLAIYLPPVVTVISVSYRYWG